MSGTITEHMRGFLGGAVVVFLQSSGFRAVCRQKSEIAANKMEEQRSLLCLNYCPSVFSDICNASEIDEPDISDVDTT